MILGNIDDEKEKFLGVPSEGSERRREPFDIERVNTERPIIIPKFISNQISIFEKSKFLGLFSCICCCSRKRITTKDFSYSELTTYYDLKQIAMQNYDTTNFNHEESLKILYIICIKTEITNDLKNKEWKQIGFQVIYKNKYL
jgi:hypothetical protein